MFDATFEREAQETINGMARMPALPPKLRDPSFASQAGELIASPFKGFAQGVNESLRAFTRAGRAVLDAGVSPEEQDATADEREAILRDKAALAQHYKDVDEALRSGVAHWRPDPQTSTAASNVLHGASRFLTKAVGYSALTTPLVGAGLTGLDEGITGSLELQDQGVDPITAAKAGAVRGVAAGVSVALPAVGKTLMSTTGLVLASGAPMYIAEQAAARKILQDADYDQQAATFDPFDPVGLAVATLAPAVFGFGLHAVRARGAKAAPSADEVAAARVILAREAADGAALADPANLAGQAAHARALETSALQLVRDGRVDVADRLPIDEAGAAKVGEMLDRMRAAADELRAQEPAPVRAEAPAPRAVDRALDSTITEARAVIDQAKAGGKFDDLASSAKPEVQNMAIGLREFEAQADAFLTRVQALRQADPQAPLSNVVADAVDSMRADPEGRAVPKAPPPNPAAEIAQQRPEMMVDLEDANGNPVRVSAKDALTTAQEALAKETADAELLMVAANCFIGGG
jgi:hypothetical protein